MSTNNTYGLSSPAAWKIRREAARIAPRHAERVLDAACGTGLLFRENDIVPNAVRVCLDNSAERLRQAPPDCTLIQGDIFAPPPMPGPFDVIFLLNTLYNLGDVHMAARAVASLSSHLAADGVIIADIRNAGNWLLQLRYAFYRWTGRFAPTAHKVSDMTAALAAKHLVVLQTVPIGAAIPFATLLVIGRSEGN